MKPTNPMVREDDFSGEMFNGNKRTGELFVSTFKNGVEIDRLGPIPLDQITPEMMEYLPPSFTREGAN